MQKILSRLISAAHRNADGVFPCLKPGVRNAYGGSFIRKSGIQRKLSRLCGNGEVIFIYIRLKGKIRELFNGKIGKGTVHSGLNPDYRRSHGGNVRDCGSFCLCGQLVRHSGTHFSFLRDDSRRRIGDHRDLCHTDCAFPFCQRTKGKHIPAFPAGAVPGEPENAVFRAVRSSQIFHSGGIILHGYGINEIRSVTPDIQADVEFLIFRRNIFR